jgi:hypothetical protein
MLGHRERRERREVHVDTVASVQPRLVQTDHAIVLLSSVPRLSLALLQILLIIIRVAPLIPSTHSVQTISFCLSSFDPLFVFCCFL